MLASKIKAIIVPIYLTHPVYEAFNDGNVAHKHWQQDRFYNVGTKRWLHRQSCHVSHTFEKCLHVFVQVWRCDIIDVIIAMEECRAN